MTTITNPTGPELPVTMSGDSHGENHTRPGYRAVVERYENGPDQCTIYPAGARGDDRMATWLTARGEAFVALDECR